VEIEIRLKYGKEQTLCGTEGLKMWLPFKAKIYG
jgi:hypothetical protein